MSELMNTSGRGTFHWQLLSTVSAIALLASAYTAGKAQASGDDADRPTVWIELGGQMEHITGQGDAFPVGFLSTYPDSSVLKNPSPLQAQNPPTFSFGGNGKVSFQPKSSDWVFSLAGNYGRASNSKNVDHQTKNPIHHEKYKSGVPYHPNTHAYFTQALFAKTKVHHQESHDVLDFQAGKDVGLGIFGRDASSTLSLGARFAQFASKATFDARARPDLHFQYFPSAAAPTHFLGAPYFHTYHNTGNASRSFHGVGPSLSWNASAPVMGNTQNGEMSFDWGINAAILFGKQKARVQHQESAHYVSKDAFSHAACYGSQERYGPCYSVVYQHSFAGRSRVHTVTVPNIGGTVSASWRVESFKFSLGYHADLFFNAMDVGIDTRKSETLGFYGPFASVSMGIGGIGGT